MTFDPNNFSSNGEFNPDNFNSEGFDPDNFSPSTEGDIQKGTKGAVAKGQVYVKPVFGLSAEQTAALHNWAESTTSTIRGIGQILHIGSDSAKDEKQKAQALENNPEYKKGAIAGDIAGTITDPVTYAIPFGKAKSLAQFVKQSAIAGGVTGFLGTTTEDDMMKGRGLSAAEGVVAGGIGGALLGKTMQIGGKLFGKGWEPFKATPEEKQTVINTLVADEKDKNPNITEEQIKSFQETSNFLLNESADAHINAKNKAEEFLTTNTPKKKVDVAVKRNPLIGHYIDEYKARYESLKESRIGDVKQGEILPPEKSPIPIEPKIETPTTVEGNTVPEVKSLTNKETGGISPQLAVNLGGAAGGAALDPEDPLTGAVVGLGIAHGAGKIAAKIADKVAEVSTKNIPEDILKESRSLIGITSNSIRNATRLSYTEANKIVDQIPDASRREAITHAIENPSLSNTLTTEENKVKNDLISKYDNLGKKAQEAGVIDELRSNYINHIIDFGKDKSRLSEAIDFFFGKGQGGTGGTGSTSTKFSKARTYGSIQALEDAGFKVKTKDPAELYKIYADSVERAIAGKNLVNNLVKQKSVVKLGKDRSVPYGWTVNPTLPNYAINPDLAPLVSHIFDSSNPSTMMRTATAITNAVKRLNVIGSFFHSYNLLGSMALSSPSTALKEIGTGFRGVRAATKAFREGGMGDFVDNAIKNGLVLEAPIDVDRHVFGHIGAATDDLASRIGISTNLEKGGKTLEKYTTGITDKVTWDYMHTGGKLLIYNKLLEDAKLKNPTIDVNTLGKEVATYVNNAFGGLNWTQIAADTNKKIVHEFTNPRSRAVMALGLFAPDWTLSTVRTALDGLIGKKGTGIKGILPSILGGNPQTSTDLSRQYLLRTSLAYLTLFNGINLMTSGKPIWGNKDPTRIEFEDGTSIQVAKHAMEPAEWALHPEKTLANKMAFLPRAGIMYWGEKQYAFGPELEDKSGISKIKEISKTTLPFQVTSAMNAPEGQGLERAISGTIGIPEYGMTIEQRRQKQIEQARKRVRRSLEQRGIY